jgi:hypothetical protein
VFIEFSQKVINNDPQIPNKMTEIEDQIFKLLVKGWSYTQIQEHLQVSSKTIAAVRKVYFPSTESTTDALSGNSNRHIADTPPLFSPSSTTVANTIKPNNYQPIKNKKPMADYEDEFEDEDDDSSITKLGLEKYRLKLEHERELAKIEASSEKDSLELRLREDEMKIKRDEIDAIKQQKANEMRSLLFRTKKLSEQCIDDEYNYEEVETMLEEARKALSESEQYCFINQITYVGTESHSILSKMIVTLTDFLESTDEDESGDLEFDNSLERLISRTTFQSF